MINNIMDLIYLVDNYYNYLAGKIDFDQNGFPIFKKEHYSQVIPKRIIPYQFRKQFHANKENALCFFSPDERLYPRLEKIFEEIEEYKKYVGVVGMDITITDDMDEELKKFINLVNNLFNAILVVNGIKIYPNTRSIEITVPLYQIWCSGFLGCKYDKGYKYIDKMIKRIPKEILIYGKKDKYVNQKLDVLGISYRYYEDMHKINRRNINGGF